MTLHLPTLLFTCMGVLALSAAAMTLFGATQRIYRGFWWWVAAQWMLVAGVLLRTVSTAQVEWTPLAAVLMLQWPTTVLAGMRRFDARERLNVPSTCDGLVLALACMLWLAAWAGSTQEALHFAVFSGAMAMLCAYSASLLLRLRAFRTSFALKALVGVEAAAAAGHAVGASLAGASLFGIGIGDGFGLGLAAAFGLPMLLATLAMSYLGMLLSHERTEGELRSSRRKLRYLADTDILTQLPNRRHFHELANQALDAISVEAAAVMMFDIDHFKHINDLLGHASGDEALRQVALAVRGSLRGNDLAGRLGGDEFGVLLPNTSVAEAMAAASRIAAQLEHRQIAPRSAPLSLSFGVVQAAAGERIADVLRRADQALYEAKRQGRSRAVSASGNEGRPVFSESQAMGLGRL